MSEVVSEYWMGMDVAKDTFDAALVRPGQHYPQTPLREVPVKTFSRDPQGVAQCLTWMRTVLHKAPAPPTVRGIMEATGMYSIELCAWLCEQCAMLAPAIVNPEQTSAFAKSMALRNKTDHLDARALAFYGAERRPDPYEPLTPEHRQLRELSRYRDALIKEKVAEGNRAEQQPHTKLLRTIQAQRERQRTRDIKKVQDEMKRLIDNTPQLKQDYELLNTIPGVAFITTAVILAEMGDLRRFARARQATAFAGVTPRQTTSGTSVNGRPRMSKKGNARVRQALYMAAMSAIRFNAPLRAKYEALVQQGKAPMVALGAIMRKLLTIMRAMLLSNSKFDPQWKTSKRKPA
jgi:transposase